MGVTQRAAYGARPGYRCSCDGRKFATVVFSARRVTAPDVSLCDECAAAIYEWFGWERKPGAAEDEMEGTLSPDHALPCPFCGEQPEIEPWHGGGPEKHMVACQYDECDVQPSVSGETVREALDNWNRRP